jgi:transposase
MMGRLNHDQGQLFYSFCLDEAVPDDHLVRQIAGVLDLSWVHCELAPYYAKLGRPSIDPVLMIRMLIIGYVFAIRSERANAPRPDASPRLARPAAKQGVSP